MRILGIDPGIHGGLAIVDVVDGAAPLLINATDIPTIGAGAKERVDVASVRLHPRALAAARSHQARPGNAEAGLLRMK